MDQEMNVNKVDSLAKDVLMLSRNTLLVNLRFLDAALSQFSLEAQPGSSISTDGQTLYYDALYVLRAYRAEHAVPVRDYLHLVLHCIFRHMYNHTEKDPEVWNLACDIAVEHSISELGLTAVAVEREKKQQEITSRLKEEIGLLTAEKLSFRRRSSVSWSFSSTVLRMSSRRLPLSSCISRTLLRRLSCMAVMRLSFWESFSSTRALMRWMRCS